MWAVAVGEGLQPSELQRLTWPDVRWTTRTLVVRGDDAGEGKTALSVAETPLTPIAYPSSARGRAAASAARSSSIEGSGAGSAMPNAARSRCS